MQNEDVHSWITQVRTLSTCFCKTLQTSLHTSQNNVPLEQLATLDYGILAKDIQQQTKLYAKYIKQKILKNTN